MSLPTEVIETKNPTESSMLALPFLFRAGLNLNFVDKSSFANKLSNEEVIDFQPLSAWLKAKDKENLDSPRIFAIKKLFIAKAMIVQLYLMHLKGHFHGHLDLDCFIFNEKYGYLKLIYSKKEKVESLKITRARIERFLIYSDSVRVKVSTNPMDQTKSSSELQDDFKNLVTCIEEVFGSSENFEEGIEVQQLLNFLTKLNQIATNKHPTQAAKKTSHKASNEQLNEQPDLMQAMNDAISELNKIRKGMLGYSEKILVTPIKEKDRTQIRGLDINGIQGSDSKRDSEHRQLETKLKMESFAKAQPIVAEKVDVAHLEDPKEGLLYPKATLDKILKTEQENNTSNEKRQKIRKFRGRSGSNRHLTELEKTLGLNRSLIFYEDQKSQKIPVTLYSGDSAHLLGSGGNARVKIGFDEQNREWVAVRIEEFIYSKYPCESIYFETQTKKDLLLEEVLFKYLTRAEANVKELHHQGILRGCICRQIESFNLVRIKIYQIQNVLGRNLLDCRGRGRVLEIALQMVEAVQNLHRGNKVHCDIKLHNFMLNEKTGEIRLIDFEGIYTLNEHSESAFVPINHLIFTPDYAAPEIQGPKSDKISEEHAKKVIDPRPLIDGVKHAIISKKADVYSLGISLYQWFDCMVPFTSGQRYELNEIIKGMREEDQLKRWTLDKVQLALLEFSKKHGFEVPSEMPKKMVLKMNSEVPEEFPKKIAQQTLKDIPQQKLLLFAGNNTAQVLATIAQSDQSTAQSPVTFHME